MRAAGIQAFWSGKLEDAERRRWPFRSYCNDRFAEHVGALPDLFHDEYEAMFADIGGWLVLRHSRREILWLGVTAHPSAQWVARQLSEAYGWAQPDVLDDRRRDHVALCIGQGLLFPTDLEPQRKAHVVAQFLSDGRWPEH